jgi:DNA-binding response OmpR family regulator
MPKTILIMEDTEDICKALSLRLGFYGYSSIAAHDGREGLVKTREEKPDLILLDIRLPELNGFEFMEVFFADKEISHIPIIMISAVVEPEIERKCLEMGARYYVTKPFDHVYLKSCIEDCIGLPDG